MQLNYCVYWPETGEVICAGHCSPPSAISLQVNSWPGHYVYPEGIDGETHYMVEGAPVPRPALAGPSSFAIVADAIEEVTVALPAGTSIGFQGKTAVSDGQPFAFTTDMPGTYVFTFDPPFPYVPHTIVIEATNAV